MSTLGVIFPPSRPPEELRAVALAAERSGLEQLWLWEDCFSESGIASAAAVLGWTERLGVAIGLLPVPLRNVALTAMELATLERLFPGRVAPGVGHGVAGWMEQVGAKAASPMTLLREYTCALRALLHGDTVTSAGRYVTLTDVALDWPPATAPPLYVGGVGPRTLELAGELGDGVILTGGTTPEMVRGALGPLRTGRGDRPGDPDVVVFVEVPGRADAARVVDTVAGFTDAGATHVALLPVGDGPGLEQFVGFVAEDVTPRLG